MQSKFQITLSLLILLTLSQSAISIPLNVDFIKNTIGYHSGSAYDSSTGKYYERNYSNNQVRVYNNKAAFESNYASQTLYLQGGTYGTYFEVQNGKIFSRSDSSTSSASVWDANSGVKIIQKAPIQTMGGINGASTFNWGGYSGVNFMGDGDDLYLMGRNSNQQGWQINKMDQNLNILSTVQYNKYNLGYSFIINDFLFSSDYYSSNYINSVINLNTGIQSNVDFHLEGMGSLYMTNINYNAIDDTLYLHDLQGSSMFSLAGASNAFGVASVSVSEPASIALFGLGLIGLGFIRRKHK